MQEKGVLVFFSLVLISGFLLLGQGITGMFSVDWETTYCSDQVQCNSPEVCCKFYEEEAGICEAADKCYSITQVTKQEKLSMTTQKPLTQTQVESIIKTETPQRFTQELPTIIAALILVIIGLVYLDREKALNRSKLKETKKNESKS